MAWIFYPAAAACVGFAGLLGRRALDRRDDRLEMKRLRALQPSDPIAFSSDMVAGLPEPARRYFTYTITEGTVLYTVAEIDMTGQFGMGDKQSPEYLDMHAKQVLAAPVGFIWQMSAQRGAMHLSGSDSARWTRFWIAGLAPVARLGGNRDHRRAAFGRYIAEALFWTPAALLPGAASVKWEPLALNAARVTVEHDGMTQTAEVTVAEDGQPLQVAFPRWSDANSEHVYRVQPFGGYLHRFENVQGFRLPTYVEAGNFFGTDDYFPFFKAKVTSIRFPKGRGV